MHAFGGRRRKRSPPTWRNSMTATPRLRTRPSLTTFLSSRNGHRNEGQRSRRPVGTRRKGSRLAIPLLCATDLWAALPGGGHLVQATIKEGRRRPPNTNWIDYTLPAVLIRPELARGQATTSEQRPRVAMVRFGLFRRVPIRLQELARVAREVRDQACRNFETETGRPSCRLTGRKADGGVATGHQHAFWLPEPDMGTGYLHRCAVWLPDGTGGIDQRELDALLGIQRIFLDDDYPVLVVAERVIETCPKLASSRRWRSLTPFLASLHSRPGRRDVTPSERLGRMVEEITGASPRVTWTSGPGSMGRLTMVRAHLYHRGKVALDQKSCRMVRSGIRPSGRSSTSSGSRCALRAWAVRSCSGRSRRTKMK